MSQLREIVNGGLLAHTQERKVSLIGLVTNVNPNSTSFEMKTSDNVSVTVNLPSTLDDLLEGYVEVHGTCQSRNSINADEYIVFSSKQSEGFDTNGYNKLCALLQQIPDVYNTC